MKKKRETPINQRGQVSIEFILVVGAVLVMVIAVFPYVQKQSELNKALTAARDGAEYAIALKGLGYQSPSGQKTPEGVMKLTRLELDPQGIEDGKEKYIVRMYVLAPTYIVGNSEYKNSIETSIENYARSYINYAFYGTYQTGLTIDTTHYRFTFSGRLVT